MQALMMSKLTNLKENYKLNKKEKPGTSLFVICCQMSVISKSSNF